MNGLDHSCVFHYKVSEAVHHVSTCYIRTKSHVESRLGNSVVVVVTLNHTWALTRIVYYKHRRVGSNNSSHAHVRPYECMLKLEWTEECHVALTHAVHHTYQRMNTLIDYRNAEIGTYE